MRACVWAHVNARVRMGTRKCARVYMGTHRCARVYMGTPKCARVYMGTPKCARVYMGTCMRHAAGQGNGRNTPQWLGISPQAGRRPKSSVPRGMSTRRFQSMRHAAGQGNGRDTPQWQGISPQAGRRPNSSVPRGMSTWRFQRPSPVTDKPAAGVPILSFQASGRRCPAQGRLSSRRLRRRHHHHTGWKMGRRQHTVTRGDSITETGGRRQPSRFPIGGRQRHPGQPLSLAKKRSKKGKRPAKTN
ncbi:hypothetical protein FKM82_024027 [Ascaphus truei]